MPPGVSGRTVVVTGASSGIGEAAALELSRRGARVVPVGRDPGARLAAPFLGSAKSGASTLVYLAASPDAADVSGGYFVDSRPARTSAQAHDDSLAGALWERSEELTGLR